FEWTTDKLGSQGTVCGGGRYDKMVEELGGRATPAIGFGMGMERLILLCQACEVKAKEIAPLVTTVFLGKEAERVGLTLVESIRDAMPGEKIMLNLGGGSVRSQMRKADKSGARWALIMGEAELQNGSVVVKDLREEGSQETISQSELVAWLKNAN